MLRSCGYTGHVCDTYNGTVKFISRYRNENDYCVGGRRIHLLDDGTVWAYDTVSAEEFMKLQNFLLDEYADYLKWRKEFQEKYQFYIPLKEHPFQYPNMRIGTLTDES